VSGDLGMPTELGRSPRISRWLKNGVIAAVGLLVVGLYLLVFRPITNEVAHLNAALERTNRPTAEIGVGYPDNPGEYQEYARSTLERMRKLFGELAEQFEITVDVTDENLSLDDFPTLRHVCEFLAAPGKVTA